VGEPFKVIACSQMLGERKINLRQCLIWQNAEHPCIEPRAWPDDLPNNCRARPGWVQFVPMSQSTGTELQRVVSIDLAHFRIVAVGLRVAPKNWKHVGPCDLVPTIGQQV